MNFNTDTKNYESIRERLLITKTENLTQILEKLLSFGTEQLKRKS